MNKKKQRLSGNINDYPLVEVTWFDAVSDSSWLSIDKATAAKPANPHSLGYKLHHTKDRITLFTDYIVEEDGTLTVGNITTIPAAWIQDITEITFK